MEAKELQAERARTAFSRLELVGRLGLPRSALGRLVGASALTAGMYGAACHVVHVALLPAMLPSRRLAREKGPELGIREPGLAFFRPRVARHPLREGVRRPAAEGALLPSVGF